ncbi:MAG: hypothetical protein NVS9B5_34980 [Terriglobales bacterium]
MAKLPDGPQWLYEIKLDGYRAVGVKVAGKATLYSRRRKSFNEQFPGIVEALFDLPDDTVVDGEIVALNSAGRPDFHALQSFRSNAERVRYFVFDLLVYKGRDLTSMPLVKRRALMRSALEFTSSRATLTDHVEASATHMLDAVREQGLEGIVAKRKNGVYEAGQRTGSWIKYRVNRGQELVIGGYLPGPHGFDSIIVGYYRGTDFIYVARVRNGFVPDSRRQLFEKLRKHETKVCPFANLPDLRPSRWGESLNAEKMKKCVWLRPEVVVQLEFLQWTSNDRLRHARFVGLRTDKRARDVVKEHLGELK